MEPLDIPIPRWERRLVGALARNVFWRGRRGGPWPVPAQLSQEEVRLVGNDGADLAARWFPLPAEEGPVRGVVVLAHPDRRYGQHWFVKDGRVAWLLARGFEVLTFDFAMYGGSRGGSTYLHDDVLAAARWAGREAGGLPVHVWGVSLGAFAATNAAPDLGFVDGLVLESPYPSFGAWSEGAGGGDWRGTLFDRAFPRTVRRIDARTNLARAKAKRILVVASAADTVTPIRLSRDVASSGPPGRTAYVELDGAEHLALFEDERYRAAVLSTFEPGAPLHDVAVRSSTSRSRRAASSAEIASR
ncbi:MAG TPA: hypothetical protein VI997_07325 [Candidatus Thermoplasmatota archaeon]|nr:hypothetical protein [Candidatus Thermoplasmatota archaeon]